MFLHLFIKCQTVRWGRKYCVRHEKHEIHENMKMYSYFIIKKKKYIYIYQINSKIKKSNKLYKYKLKI